MNNNWFEQIIIWYRWQSLRNVKNGKSYLIRGYGRRMGSLLPGFCNGFVEIRVKFLYTMGTEAVRHFDADDPEIAPRLARWRGAFA